MDRFLRIKRLIGAGKAARLAASRVTVVGLGAVGSYAAEGLARSGIGSLRLVDYDLVHITNINRQLYALESTIGRAKVDVAGERILDINPAAQIEKYRAFVHADTLETLFGNAPDLVLDAIDGVGPKVSMLTYLYRKGTRVITSMGAALRRDPAKIRTGDLFDSVSCPLARMVRKKLAANGVGRGITCVYSTEKVDYDFTAEDLPSPEAGELVRGRKRHILGSLPTLTGIFGLTLANLAIKILTCETD